MRVDVSYLLETSKVYLAVFMLEGRNLSSARLCVNLNEVSQLSVNWHNEARELLCSNIEMPKELMISVSTAYVPYSKYQILLPFSCRAGTVLGSSDGITSAKPGGWMRYYLHTFAVLYLDDSKI